MTMAIAVAGQKRKRTASTNIAPTPQAKHPYLSGNFAPIQQTLPLTKCSFTGRIPEELADGEYVRNGSNPVSNDDLGRDAHWFDGDGMLSGVAFTRDTATGAIQPEFVNQFLLTDVYLSAISSPALRVPVLPSIATLVNPVASFIWVTLRILRTLLLVLLSHLPGSKQPIKKISVANTNVVYHDGRALATCESGPPLRIQLPGLETVGWYDGARAEGEPVEERPQAESVLGEEGGIISFMREWSTAHPKIDPVTKEMIMYHSTFVPPYVQYSIIPQTSPDPLEKDGNECVPPRKRKVNAPVPGMSGARMMHDFGVSRMHTVIMDLPLSLDPVNQLKGLPPVSYDSGRPSRFGVFPRWDPTDIQWFETDACCIFHTANTWDEFDAETSTPSVHMLACRLTSATLVFAAGNIAPPVEKKKKPAVAARKTRMPFFSKYDQDLEPAYFEQAALLESPSEEKEALLHITAGEKSDEFNSLDNHLFDEDQCRLYYYHFDLHSHRILHQWALAAIPFEFPSVRPGREMHEARYVYGCTTTTTAFGSALGKATKIDALAKIDAAALVARGRRHPPRSVTGVVDPRSIEEILSHPAQENDPIQIFRLPPGWYAQEPRFIPAASFSSSSDAEDAGYLLFYAFDESQLCAATGDVPDDADPRRRARSELWILDARNMSDLVARVHLPQRVPYGLHGAWFDRDQIRDQRPVQKLRSTTLACEEPREAMDRGWGMGLWMRMRGAVEKFLR